MYKIKRSPLIVIFSAMVCIAAFSVTLPGCREDGGVDIKQQKQLDDQRKQLDEIKKLIEDRNEKNGLSKEDKKADSLKSK
jgi:hypothetical protein